MSPSPSPSSAPAVPEGDGVLAAARGLLHDHHAVMLATTGGPLSPWIAGAYFATDGDALVVLLETSGTTLQNLRAHPRVAFSVSGNDAQKDFLQGAALAQVLPDEHEPRVRQLLLAKMPWYQTFTPVVPVRIQPIELRFSSLARGWFPAKRVAIAASA